MANSCIYVQGKYRAEDQVFLLGSEAETGQGIQDYGIGGFSKEKEDAEPFGSLFAAWFSTLQVTNEADTELTFSC